MLSGLLPEKVKKPEEAETLDFDHLPKSRQQEIEDLIEQKIKERQEEELKRLLKEVTEEIEKTQKRLKEEP